MISSQIKTGPSMRKLADNIAVWSEFKELTLKYAGVSLGEGAPYLQPPEFLTKEVYQAMIDGHNQYCRTFGVPSFCQKIAGVYGPKFNRTIDWQKEILVGAGANGLLNAYITAFAHKDEEILMMEPAFPLYFDHAEIS